MGAGAARETLVDVANTRCVVCRISLVFVQAIQANKRRRTSFLNSRPSHVQGGNASVPIPSVPSYLSRSQANAYASFTYNCRLANIVSRLQAGVCILEKTAEASRNAKIRLCESVEVELTILHDELGPLLRLEGELPGMGQSAHISGILIHTLLMWVCRELPATPARLQMHGASYLHRVEDWIGHCFRTCTSKPTLIREICRSGGRFPASPVRCVLAAM